MIRYGFQPLTREQLNHILERWHPLWYQKDPMGMGELFDEPDAEVVDDVAFYFANGLCLWISLTPDGRLEASLGVPEDDGEDEV